MNCVKDVCNISTENEKDIEDIIKDNFYIEKDFLKLLKKEMDNLNNNEEDNTFKKIIEDCIRTVKTYMYVVTKKLTPETISYNLKDMNRAKKKFEKEKRKRERAVELAQKAVEKEKKAAEKAQRLAEKEKKAAEKAEKEAGKVAKITTKIVKVEEKPNLISITSFFSPKQTHVKQQIKESEVKIVEDTRYKETEEYFNLCKKNIDLPILKQSLIKMKKNKKPIAPRVIHTDSNILKLIGKINGEKYPSFILGHKISDKISGRHPLCCDPLINYLAPDSDEDEEGEDEVEGEDLSQEDANEEEEEEESNELDYNDGWLASEDTDKALSMLTKSTSGQRTPKIIQPYFGDIRYLPIELKALEIIKM